MKNIYRFLFFSLFAINAFAQQATEIDTKSVTLPRYANFAAITTAIVSPTQGMVVYKIGTASNWSNGGTAWVNTLGAVASPITLTSSSTTFTSNAIGAPGSGLAGEFNSSGTGAIYSQSSGAESVAKVLQQEIGTAGKFIFKTKGFGKQNPIVPNSNDDNRKKNRRVEILVAGF
jgi:hypothetical protein